MHLMTNAVIEHTPHSYRPWPGMWSEGLPELDIASPGVMGWGLEAASNFFRRRRRRGRRRHRRRGRRPHSPSPPKSENLKKCYML